MRWEEFFVLSKLTKTIKNYFTDPDTNIFKNYIDALLGSVILIILPMLSLISSIGVWGNANVVNYVFPISSICLAGAYDAYGRYEYKSPKNLKLGIRIAFDGVAIVLSLIAIAIQSKILTVIAPVVLIVPGVLLCFEVYSRVRTAIMISKWYAN